MMRNMKRNSMFMHRTANRRPTINTNFVGEIENAVRLHNMGAPLNTPPKGKSVDAFASHTSAGEPPSVEVRSPSSRTQSIHRRKHATGVSKWKSAVGRINEMLSGAEREHQLIHKTLILYPYSRFIQWWNHSVLVVIYYNLLAVPFMIGVREGDSISSLLLSINILCDVVLVLDIAVKMRTAILVEGVLENRPHFIRRHYYKSDFLVDVLASLPVDFIVLVSLSWHDKQYWFVRLMKLVRSLRTFRYWRQWERTSKYPSAIRAFKFILLLLICSHVVGCTYIGICRVEDFELPTTENDWHPPHFITENCHPTTYGSSINNGSCTRHLYYWGMFWALASLTGLGKDPVNPASLLETLLMFCVAILGIMIIATFVSATGQILMNLNASAVAFRQKMDTVAEFMNMRKVAKPLRERIREYYDYVEAKYGGIDDRAILEDLPNAIRSDLSLFLHREVIAKVPIFANAEPAIINQVIHYLHPDLYAPGDYIVQYGDIGKEMFFVKQGQVDIVSPEGLVQSRISDGGFFGEVALVHRVRRSASVVAVTPCEILTLRQKEFRTLLKDFPHLEDSVRDMALANQVPDDPRQIPMEPVEAHEPEELEDLQHEGGKKAFVIALEAFSRAKKKLVGSGNVENVNSTRESRSKSLFNPAMHESWRTKGMKNLSSEKRVNSETHMSHMSDLENLPESTPVAYPATLARVPTVVRQSQLDSPLADDTESSMSDADGPQMSRMTTMESVHRARMVAVGPVQEKAKLHSLKVSGKRTVSPILEKLQSVDPSDLARLAMADCVLLHRSLSSLLDSLNEVMYNQMQHPRDDIATSVLDDAGESDNEDVDNDEGGSTSPLTPHDGTPSTWGRKF